ncbi:3-isopropylmalate dehydratase, partial [Ruminococcaceae bacterium OttesenSCG-928-I18]|nr:3-isopropylmalate dehydratase [Ruminococcaceae bacterium OttesenSCG-928-I18]
FTGRVWLLGDDIDTDIIIPTEFLALPGVAEMAPHAFSPLRPELAGRIAPGDILVAGENFGCGSSREQAPEVIKALGVGAVIAKSFARIFFRNAVNNGLPVLESGTLRDEVREGDEVRVVPGQYVSYGGKKYPLAPMAENVLAILESGGLVAAMRKRNGVEG